MIIWINGAFGAGKTQTAFELNKRIPNSFVYDPENIGFFISKNIPKSIRTEDFQDCEAWRELNFSLIKHIEKKYNGVLIIPMTIVEPEYFNEIVGALKDQGISVKHYVLMASRETLLKRLKSRGDGETSWGAKQIERCIKGLSNDMFQQHINTENMSIDEVVEEIALRTDLQLKPYKASKLRKKLDRTFTQLKHIRLFK